MKIWQTACIGFSALSSGCSPRNRQDSDSEENQGRSKSTKDPELKFDPTKTSCKSICAGIQGCPVKLAHCKKEVDPPVCWSLYYTSDHRNEWCFFRKDPANCPEQFPVYCDGDSGLVLPEYRTQTISTTSIPKKRLT